MIDDIHAIAYEDRLVAFIDILGWKNLVEKSAHDKNLLQTIAMLSTAQNGMADVTSANGLRHIRMSDASVFVADPQNTLQVITLTDAITSIHTTALLHGWLARGSVVHGKVYFSQTSPTILGPALTTAYENSENGMAFYPRTILDKASREIIVSAFTKVETLSESRKLFPLTNGAPIKRGDDDLDFVSYLGGFMQSIHMDHYRAIIIRGVNENKDKPKVLQKYSWLKNYFNSVYPNDAIESA